MFFSPSTKGFYTEAIHASIPGDAIEITQEEHRALVAGQSSSLAIGIGENGRPALVTRQAEPIADWRYRCEVTRRQALIALYNAGDLAMVEAAVAQAGGVTQIEWDNALTFRRMNATVLALGQALGWTEAQLDALFQAAEQVGD